MCLNHTIRRTDMVQCGIDQQIQKNAEQCKKKTTLQSGQCVPDGFYGFHGCTASSNSKATNFDEGTKNNLHRYQGRQKGGEKKEYQAVTGKLPILVEERKKIFTDIMEDKKEVNRRNREISFNKWQAEWGVRSVGNV